MSISSIILAAGQSTRMGCPKLMIKWQDKTLLRHVIDIAKPVSKNIHVVIGAHAIYRAEIARASGKSVFNPNWHQGLGSSLGVGINSLPPENKVCLVLLADQVFVPTSHLRKLIAKADSTAANLVLSSYQNTLGPPALIQHTLFPLAKKLNDHQGAKALIPHARLEDVPLKTHQDIDTLEDVKRYLGKEIQLEP